MLKEFGGCALAGNVIDLAAGITTGAAFSQVVQSLTSIASATPWLCGLTHVLRFDHVFAGYYRKYHLCR